ncbi:hypothetical protein AAVH_20213, partial [Aphelenchoides avenae]
MTFVSVVALPLDANRLFDVLQALVPALHDKEANCGTREDLAVVTSDNAITPQEAAERRLRKRLQREERRRREKASLKAAERRERWMEWFKSLIWK